ncbi:MAG: DUF2142 domain-containing protein [Chloroflexota bacterium]
MMNHQTLDATPFKDRIKKIFSAGKYFHKAEIYLIVILLVFGVGACFLLPVSGGYDEETHLMRVWQMSSFEFIPNESSNGKQPFPAVYWEMSYRRPFLIRAVEPDFWIKYRDLSLDAHDYIYGSVDTRSVYSPPLLLPQALVMRYLGRSLRLPALTVFYACRLIGLLSYMMLAWFAVRIIPFGKWILAILVTSPVAILQASTISADAISNGVALLFIAGSLAITARKEMHWKEWLTLALLFLILFWGKLNIIPLAILPFLLIQPSQFKMRFGYLYLVVVAIGLCVVEVLGWNILAYSRFHAALEGADPLGQIKFMLGNPLNFLFILASTIWERSVGYFLNWIAIYGYAYWPIPTGTYYLYLAGLLAALFVKENDHQTIDKKIRIGLVIVFVITYLATIVSLYVTFNPVGQGYVAGVQGRYFMTVMPLLFLALACLPILKRMRVSAFLPVLLGVASLVVYMAGMYLSYHVPCGSQFYTSGLCYQPHYKNWAPDDLYSAPVSKQLALSQEIVPECKGMTELRVWTNANDADPNGTTQFILLDVAQKHEMVNVNVPNSELPNGNWYSLTFQPDWVSNGKFYLLIIRGENTGPRIAYSLKQEYPEGKLFENDQPIDKDLIFQTGCIAGLEKIRLTGLP